MDFDQGLKGNRYDSWLVCREVEIIDWTDSS